MDGVGLMIRWMIDGTRILDGGMILSGAIDEMEGIAFMALVVKWDTQ